MKKFIKNLEAKVLAMQFISIEEAMKLTYIKKNCDIDQLCNSADNIREFFCGSKVDLCTIKNAKSGYCSEDCKFCAQSIHYMTNAEVYGLVSQKEVLKLANENEKEGVNKFSLITSGRGINDNDFEKILEIYKELNKKVKINLCASLGIIKYDKLCRLKEVGVTMYHHNLETSRNYYENVCTTHSYDERISTINAAKEAGMDICAGGIIGLGENLYDRVNLAFQLRDLNVKSIPINILNPVKGTPLENTVNLTQNEILKTVAIFRFINPTAFIRLAGGRNLINKSGEKCFNSGANATITGNYLTTSGNKICDDKKMITELNLEVREND
ncbi:biotin synthase BioB [Clostridium sp. ATCC 25772]|uniref:biotin synthase BioB n=1 Tax=Clostridium sp. ATCC 25772 TaxID=1676991 RepID=UPI0007829BD0|nr:biotin synthase BioB [Clostridium sp. ATCC 25772]